MVVNRRAASTMIHSRWSNFSRPMPERRGSSPNLIRTIQILPLGCAIWDWASPNWDRFRWQRSALFEENWGCQSNGMHHLFRATPFPFMPLLRVALGQSARDGACVIAIDQARAGIRTSAASDLQKQMWGRW